LTRPKPIGQFGGMRQSLWTARRTTYTSQSTTLSVVQDPLQAQCQGSVLLPAPVLCRGPPPATQGSQTST
jgi:hypothetical protein